MDQEQLDRIEEKLDKLIEEFKGPDMADVARTIRDEMARQRTRTSSNYPTAPHEQKIDIYYEYPWQQPGTSTSP